VHVIYYLTGTEREDEREMLLTLANRNGGQFRPVPAAGRKD
jgi:enhancing lycopene biosynthesis protein 2